MLFRTFDRKCNKLESRSSVNFNPIDISTWYDRLLDAWPWGLGDTPELQSRSDQETSMFDQAYPATNYTNRDLKRVCIVRALS